MWIYILAIAVAVICVAIGIAIGVAIVRRREIEPLSLGELQDAVWKLEETMRQSPSPEVELQLAAMTLRLAYLQKRLEKDEKRFQRKVRRRLRTHRWPR